MKNIETVHKNKQSLWIDFISKNLLESGMLETLIKKNGITGLTSNPSIFEKAISDSNDYDEDIKKLLKSNSKISSYEIFEELSIYDIKKAAKLLLNIYENSNHLDGYVSIEVSPKLAYKKKAERFIGLFGNTLQSKTINFLKIVGNAKRLSLIPSILKEYQELLAQKDKRNEVLIISAYKPKAEQMEQIDA